MVPHRTITDLGIEYLFLIVSFNDENIKQLLYFWGTEIVPYRLRKSFQMFQILMFLFITTGTHSIFFLLPIFVPIKYMGLPIFQFHQPMCDGLNM